MEMITKKLIERNGQGGGVTDTGNEKKGISLDSSNPITNGDSCCSFSF